MRLQLTSNPVLQVYTLGPWPSHLYMYQRLITFFSKLPYYTNKRFKSFPSNVRERPFHYGGGWKTILYRIIYFDWEPSKIIYLHPPCGQNIFSWNDNFFFRQYQAEKFIFHRQRDNIFILFIFLATLFTSKLFQPHPDNENGHSLISLSPGNMHAWLRVYVGRQHTICMISTHWYICTSKNYPPSYTIGALVVMQSNSILCAARHAESQPHWHFLRSGASLSLIALWL